MTELIDAIQKLGTKDFVDVLAIFSPIILSIVAIFISIYTTKKQNKIALFELKYRVVSNARTLLIFEKNIYKKKNAKSILFAFEAVFETNLNNLSDNTHAMAKVINHLSIIQKEILMGQFYSGEGYRETVNSMLDKANKILATALKNKTENILINEFHDECNKFREKYLDKLIKDLKKI